MERASTPRPDSPVRICGHVGAKTVTFQYRSSCFPGLLITNRNRPVMPHYLRPLIATNLADDIGRMAAFTLDFVAPRAYGITVVHVYRIHHEGLHCLMRLGRLQREIEAYAHDSIHGALTQFDRMNFDVVVRRGEVFDVVPAEVAARDSDIVLVGAHRCARFPHLVHGSLAARVLEANRSDVVIVGHPSD